VILLHLFSSAVDVNEEAVVEPEVDEVAHTRSQK